MINVALQIKEKFISEAKCSLSVGWHFIAFFIYYYGAKTARPILKMAFEKEGMDI